MSDRYPATISIGGRLPKKLVAPLAKALAQEGIMTGDFTYIPDDEFCKNILLKASQAGLPAEFGDDQANYGMFDALERFLVKNKIAFRRHSDAYCEFNAEIMLFRPDKGMKDSKYCESNQNGKVVISFEDLRKNDDCTLKHVLEDFEIFELSLPPLEIV